MKTTARWQNMGDLERDLAALSRGMQAGALKGAMRAAASPVVKGAQASSPSRSVKKSLTSVVRVTSGVAITARIGAKRGSPGGRILHLIEKGTGAHDIKPRRARVLAGQGRVFGKAVRHPGSRARPFFRKALPENRAESERKFGSALRQIVDKMHLKLLKKRAGA